MKYIVLDLEWNQPAAKNKEVKDLPFEIIEIGAVKLDENFQMLDRFQSIVRPVVYPQLNHISSQITGFTTPQLQYGPRFPKVYEAFQKWCGTEDFYFCTWGCSDLTELQRNMKHYDIPLLPRPVLYYDLQEVFGILNQDEAHRRSLEYAVEFYRIKKKKNFHRALSDAYYTALAMVEMEPEQVRPLLSIDTYQPPLSREEEVTLTYGNYSRYVSRIFPNRFIAQKDSGVLSVKCCVCEKKMQKEFDWFNDNNKNLFCLASCPEHGLQSAKIRFKHTGDDHVFALKDIRLADDDTASHLRKKQQAVQEKENTESSH